jgi:hypothetical protein
MSTAPENTLAEVPSPRSHRCKSLEKFPSARLIHKLVYFGDSDITIRSSDGVLFKLHQVNLKVSLGAWNHSVTGIDEVVQLSERSAVLDLLFQFCYPERHPRLDDLAFDDLAELAKAAETYKVFSAIDICRIRVKYVLQFVLEPID